MKSFFIYFIAYLCILITLGIFIVLVLNIFNIINLNMSDPSALGLIAIPSGYIYHKYKPIEFKELLKVIKEKF